MGYATGINNQLNSDGTYNYQYDAEGNRIKRTKISDNYTWDNRNRLTTVVSKNAAGIVTQTVVYEYDIDDQRIGKTINGVVEKYYLDGNQIAFVTDAAGNQLFHYLYGLNVDAVMAQDSPTGMVWSLSDRLGTVDTLTNGSGAVIDKRTFDSFGRLLSETNPSLKFRYGYTGREQDKETGLDYYRARYYDPANGRFIRVDPAGFGAGDTNLYRYVGNRSTMYTDPTGMWAWDEAWNNFSQSAQKTLNFWGGGAADAGNYVTDSLRQSTTNFRNTVTSNAQAGLEYWAGVAVAGQNEGGIIGGAKQITGSVLGLFSSLATEDNIDKTNETLAFVFGGEIVAGLTWVKSIAAISWVKTVTPFVKSGLAAIGVYQGGGQVSQAWTGVGENGRQLSMPERVTIGITGLATIGSSILSLKTQCFVAGTEIQTIDGTKNIEDIHVGDWVLSDDPNTPGEIEYKQVLQTFVKDTTNLVDIYIDGEKITTTEEHPFWVPDLGWVAAKDLHAGTLLQTKTESWLDIDKVEKHGGLTTVYNFEVQGFHTYFVSDLGLLVHNMCSVRGEDNSKPLPEGGQSIESRMAEGGKPASRVRANPNDYYYDPNTKTYNARPEPAPNYTIGEDGIDPRAIPCFAEGTLIVVENGHANIEDIQIGDIVLSFDENNKTVKSKPVLNILRNKTLKWFDIEMEDEFITTKKHRFWVEDNKSWIEAQFLHAGMNFRTVDGKTKTITRIEAREINEEPTFNLTVDECHTYFVGKNGFLVHNEGETTGKIYVGEIGDTVVYVGKTKNSLKDRSDGHQRDAIDEPDKYGYKKGMKLRLVLGELTDDQMKYHERRVYDEYNKEGNLKQASKLFDI